jgi:hypothetical protein
MLFDWLYTIVLSTYLRGCGELELVVATARLLLYLHVERKVSA